MSSFWETYPCTRHPIEFKPLEDLVNDNRYRLYPYPSLEHSRQLRLDTNNPDEFESIPRDFCLLSSPGKVSWQTQEAQNNPKIEIFHTDVIKIPTSNLKKKFPDLNHTGVSYLTRWYYHDLTLANVRKILKDRFDLSIPLSSESSSDHWIPAIKLYNVEIEKDVWENRLVVFFDGNIGTSNRSMRWRVDEYGQLLKEDNLGVTYLATWRSTWMRSESGIDPESNKVLENTERNESLNSPNKRLETEAKPAMIKMRGRKRRSAQRQLRLGISLTAKQLPEEIILVAKAILPPTAIVRGRLRRRERRRNLGKTHTSSLENGFSTLPTDGIPVTGDKTNFISDGHTWRFRNGEIGPVDQNNKIPLILSLVLDTPISKPPEGVAKEASEASQEFLTPRDSGLPLFNIRALQNTATSTFRKLYRIFSYCNRPLDPAGTPGLPPEQIIVGGFGTDDEDMSGIPDYEIHIANLIDEVGVIDAEPWRAGAFFSVIEATPDFQTRGPSFVTNKQDTNTKELRDNYWQKFSVLTAGFNKPAQKRHLPYSVGYGLEHNHPRTVIRANRSGYFDVDSVTKTSKRPRWRANWRFEMFNGSEKCECSFESVSHDFNTCKHLAREEPDINSLPWREIPMPQEILSGPLYFLHRPHEFLEELGNTFHKYSPPWVDTSKEPVPPSEALENAAKEQQEKQSKESERAFEMGICSLMALGVPKDIEMGMILLQKSAELEVYGVEVKVPDGQLLRWLCETAFQGSKLALEQLRFRHPTIYKEYVSAGQLTFNFQYPKTINYTDDILPHFDMSNTELLLSQLENLPGSEQEGTIRSKTNLNVMAKVTEGDDHSPARYFIFGSLLHIASYFGFTKAVDVLLDHGFDIDGQNALPSARTPLLCAMKRGHAKTAKLLVERGAKCDPLILWVSDPLFCSTPTALHYLVNIEKDEDVRKLASLLVKQGADVNFKCNLSDLKDQAPAEIPKLRGNSVTPLRWAVIHRKAYVVKVLLNLGAKFAYEEYLRPSSKSTSDINTVPKGCLLLETPCTDLDILEMFFARARVPGLPIEFSQTPLGLLVSEDDGPERRLRLGFRDFDDVRDALNLLLELQPGCEKILMWSAVRHDHISIVIYLIDELGWSVESSWRGLTSFHTALLYGRTEIAMFLRTKGANPKAVTESRHLTSFHLIMLLPRHAEVDQKLFDLVSDCGIEVDAREKVDGLTAFHLAVRNRKMAFVKQLLQMGADFSIPVKDQLNLLSQGRGGFFRRTPDRPQLFTETLTILGEVVLQYIQDNFYDVDYVSDLILILLAQHSLPLGAIDLVIDDGIGLSLLHLLAIFQDDNPRLTREEKELNARRPYSEDPPPLPPAPITVQSTILQLILNRSQLSVINVQDFQGDTPLHYACAAHKLEHIRTLLAAGADPSIRNNVGLAPVEVLAWSIIYLSGNTLQFDPPRKSFHPTIDLSAGYQGRRNKRTLHSANTLSIALAIFASVGCIIPHSLQTLVLAWHHALAPPEWTAYHDSPRRNHLEIVPEESTRDIHDDLSPDSRYKSNGKHDWNWDKKVKRPYFLGTIAGPSRWSLSVRPWSAEWDKKADLDFERAAL